MKIGFTGTRESLPFKQQQLLIDVKALWSWKSSELHHGMCVGADATAHKIFQSSGYKIVGHPPLDDKHMMDYHPNDFLEIFDPQEYLVRNHSIVDETDILIACPKAHTEELRSGTWATIRYARQQGKPVMILV